MFETMEELRVSIFRGYHIYSQKQQRFSHPNHKVRCTHRLGTSLSKEGRAHDASPLGSPCRRLSRAARLEENIGEMQARKRDNR